jgi:Family of unknown function (DUF6338)
VVLPGFIVTELAESRRATKRRGGDFETILRSLWYSAVLHVIAAGSGWTAAIYRDIDRPGEWERHLTAVALYAAVVVVIAPTALGLVLGAYLRHREQQGSLTWFDYALGGRDARQAWDFLFGHLDAGFVILHLKSVPDHVNAGNGDGANAFAPWRTVYGKFGTRSWATQTPSDRYDLYLEQVWPADATGRILGEFNPPRGMLVSADEIAALYVVDPGDAAEVGSESRSTKTRMETS